MNKLQAFGLKMLGLGGLTSFEGANISTSRSYILQPSFDQQKQITPYTRTQLLGKYHWLRNNVGLVRRMTNGTARYAIGQGVIPKAMTSDLDWNKAHDTWFETVATNPLLFDFEGRINFYRAQRQVAQSMVGEGEIFTNCVDAEHNVQEGDYLPKFQLLAAGRVADVNSSIANKDKTFDGLKLDEGTNRVISYRVPDLVGTGFQDLPAENVIHTYDPERTGQIRGLTWFYHGVNSLVDIMDLTALEKHAAKVHSALAATVKNKSGNVGSQGLTGMMEQMLTKAQMQAQTANDPNAKNKFLERIFGGGLVPFLSTDEELTLLTSKRPSSTFTGFLDWLVRDIAWGFGVAPEFIWAVAGLGGANTRFILADSAFFFEEVQGLVVDNWAAPVRNRMVAAAMLAGQNDPVIGLPACKDPLWRTKVYWQGPARVSADTGKDADAAIDLLANGMNTWADFWGGKGFTGDVKIDARIHEVARAKKRIGEIGSEYGLKPEDFTYADVFPMGANNLKAMMPKKMQSETDATNTTTTP